MPAGPPPRGGRKRLAKGFPAKLANGDERGLGADLVDPGESDLVELATVVVGINSPAAEDTGFGGGGLDDADVVGPPMTRGGGELGIFETSGVCRVDMPGITGGMPGTGLVAPGSWGKNMEAKLGGRPAKDAPNGEGATPGSVPGAPKVGVPGAPTVPSAMCFFKWASSLSFSVKP